MGFRVGVFVESTPPGSGCAVRILECRQVLGWLLCLVVVVCVERLNERADADAAE